jgi:hypothetical protein
MTHLRRRWLGIDAAIFSEALLFSTDRANLSENFQKILAIDAAFC